MGPNLCTRKNSMNRLNKRPGNLFVENRVIAGTIWGIRRKQETPTTHILPVKLQTGALPKYIIFVWLGRRSEPSSSNKRFRSWLRTTYSTSFSCLVLPCYSCSCGHPDFGLYGQRRASPTARERKQVGGLVKLLLDIWLKPILLQFASKVQRGRWDRIMLLLLPRVSITNIRVFQHPID